MINFLLNLGLIIVVACVLIWGAKCAIEDDRHTKKIQIQKRKLLDLQINNESFKNSLIKSQLKTEEVKRNLLKGIHDGRV